jgi:protein TonB
MTDRTVLNSAPRYFSLDSARERAAIVVIVVVFHCAAFAAWLMQQPSAPVSRHEMEVAMLFAPVVVRTEEISPKIVPVPQPRVVTPEPAPVEVAEQPHVNNVPDEIPPVPAPVVAAAPVVDPVEPVVEPDYKAFYLNNHLTYPLAARRMGIQGRVVLNVEVLVEGVSGQVNLDQSSGYDMLDRAAMESVKTWRFIPARRAGLPITMWFKIPILFSLKENEA